jgi:hypothetical protein
MNYMGAPVENMLRYASMVEEGVNTHRRRYLWPLRSTSKASYFSQRQGVAAGVSLMPWVLTIDYQWTGSRISTNHRDIPVFTGLRA